MKEEAIIFNYKRNNIRGIYSPSENKIFNKSLILFLGNPDWSSWGPRRVFTEAARTFSEVGFCTFRFDNISSNSDSSIGINSEQEAIELGVAIERLIDYIKNDINPNIEKVILLGYCGGSFLSINLSRKLTVDALVLWSLKMDLHPNFKGFSNLRSDIKTHYVFNEKSEVLPLLIINGDLYSKYSIDKLAISDMFPVAYYNVKYHSIEHCDQYFSSVKLKRELISQTKIWLVDFFNH